MKSDDNPSRIRAVIFDFDDTLLARFGIRSRSLIEAAMDFGLSISPQQIRELWGNPFQDLVRALMPSIDYAILYSHYQTVMLQRSPQLLPGAFEVIEFLY